MKNDKQLTAEVLEELRWEPTVHSTDIKVSVDKGVVTLSGSVPHYAEKHSAERAAQRVEGVKAIAQELDVNLTGIHDRNDADIAQAVVDTLRWHVWVPSHIQATVEKGWVTLEGDVHWGYERDAAEKAVGFISGVKGIFNNITLKPTVQPTTVKSAIETALKRNAEVDAEQISVSSDGSRVTLGGTVHSWNERDEAAWAAWSAPGVAQVVNNLAVID